MFILIAGTVILLMLMFLTAIPAVMAGALFDTPGSEKKASIILIFLAAFSFPFFCLGWAMAAWIDYFLGSARLFWFFLPLVNIAIIVIAFRLSDEKNKLWIRLQKQWIRENG